jgi:hypothetical protein
MTSDLASFVGVAGIESGLAAAGLGLREVDVVAEALEDLGNGDSHLRKNLIDDAGDKQGDARAQSGSLT